MRSHNTTGAPSASAEHPHHDTQEPAQMIVHSADQLPDRYAMVGKGRCMEPLYMDGGMLVFDKNEQPEAGDTVILWFKVGKSPMPGTQCIFKRLVGMPPVSLPFNPAPDNNAVPLVMVEMLNPRRTLAYPAADLIAVHKCLGTATRNEDGTACFKPKADAPQAPEKTLYRPDCIEPSTILAAIETRLAETRMSPSRFGRDAVGDPKIVSDLRRGRWITTKTEARLVDFLNAMEV